MLGSVPCRKLRTQQLARKGDQFIDNNDLNPIFIFLQFSPDVHPQFLPLLPLLPFLHELLVSREHLRVAAPLFSPRCVGITEPRKIPSVRLSSNSPTKMVERFAVLRRTDAVVAVVKHG